MGRILILNLIAGCALLLAACNKDMTEFNRQQIVGKWVPVDKEVMGGYRFSLFFLLSNIISYPAIAGM